MYHLTSGYYQSSYWRISSTTCCSFSGDPFLKLRDEPILTGKNGPRYSPNLLDSPGKNGLVTFALTFLTSTCYIKNPFLKSKVIEVPL